MANPMKYPGGLLTSAYDSWKMELASTFFVPLVAGSMLYMPATCVTAGWNRNKFWIVPTQSPCTIHFQMLSNATTYRAMLHKMAPSSMSGEWTISTATHFICYLSHATSGYAGKNVMHEYSFGIREGEFFNIAVNQGAAGGKGAPAAGLWLYDLIIWEEY